MSAVAGVRWLARPGDRVQRGDVSFELHTEEPDRVHGARVALEGALTGGDALLPVRPLVIDRTTEPGGVDPAPSGRRKRGPHHVDPTAERDDGIELMSWTTWA